MQNENGFAFKFTKFFAQKFTSSEKMALLTIFSFKFIRIVINSMYRPRFVHDWNAVQPTNWPQEEISFALDDDFLIFFFCVGVCKWANSIITYIDPLFARKYSY